MKKGLFDLSGKVSLITGGNGGIGLGMAKGLASCGSDIAIWGIDNKKNEKAKEELKEYGTKIISYEVDVASEEEVSNNMQNVINDLALDHIQKKAY